jgi:hypothetical protein
MRMSLPDDIPIDLVTKLVPVAVEVEQVNKPDVLGRLEGMTGQMVEHINVAKFKSARPATALQGLRRLRQALERQPVGLIEGYRIAVNLQSYLESTSLYYRGRKVVVLLGKSGVVTLYERIAKLANEFNHERFIGVVDQDVDVTGRAPIGGSI